MKKNVILFLVVMLVFVVNVNAVEQEQEDIFQNPYDGRITIYEDGWTIIESPLEDTGIKVYLKRDENAEEVLIDVERSLASADNFLNKVYNCSTYMLPCCFSNSNYNLRLHQLLVLLAIAAEIPIFQFEMDQVFYYGAIPAEYGFKYGKTIGENWPSVWKISWRSIMAAGNSINNCLGAFKEKFKNCKRIKLQLFSSDQKIVIKSKTLWQTFVEVLNYHKLKIVYADKKED